MKTKRIVIASIVLVLTAVVVLLRSRMEGRAPSRPQTALEGVAPATPSPERPRQSVALQAAPTEEPEGPITATAQIVRGDNSVVEAKSLDGEFARILVERNEVLKIRLMLNGFDANRPIRIDADNGGSLNRKLGPLVLQPSGEDIEFQYAIGGHKGRYTLLITQGHRQELLEFRVGPEPPTGKPGPVRVFNPDRVTGGRS